MQLIGVKVCQLQRFGSEQGNSILASALNQHAPLWPSYLIHSCFKLSPPSSNTSNGCPGWCRHEFKSLTWTFLSNTLKVSFSCSLL